MQFNIEQRSRRIYQRIDELATYSELEEGLGRFFCSPSAREVNERILSWAKEDNLIAHVDEMANIRLRSKRHDDRKKNFVVASHLDSVINAGKYDGPLGFLIAFELLSILQSKDADLPFNVEAIGFSEEEGVRYSTPYLSSNALTGNFKPEWLEQEDAGGIKMKDALRQFGCNPDKLAAVAISKDKFMGYYEVHIEQGPLLQAHNLPVGYVTNIYAQTRVFLDFEGVAGHAGTVPMHLRQDALCAFSEFCLAMETYALDRKEKLVATIGKCALSPGAINVIPEQVRCTLDIRSGDEKVLKKALEDIRSLAKQIAEKRNVRYNWNPFKSEKPIQCDEKLTDLLRESIAAKGLSVMGLSSGAGHDAVAVSEIAPVAMLFVRCKDGISHNPAEYASLEDVQCALEVSSLFIEKLIESGE